jgi:hypothetical protein
MAPVINFGYGLNKLSYDVNDELKSQIYGNLNYRNDFRGNEELLVGVGFKYYF